MAETYLQWREEYSEILGPVSLTLPKQYAQARARDLARFLGDFTKPSNWWIGDLCLQMESRWGIDRASIAASLGISVDTLYNITAVCAAWPISRRRENVSFSHHTELAAKSNSTAHVADAMLEKCETEHLSTKKLREVLAGKSDIGHEAQKRTPRTPVAPTPPVAQSFVGIADTRHARVVLNDDISVALLARYGSMGAAEEAANSFVARALIDVPNTRIAHLEFASA